MRRILIAVALVLVLCASLIGFAGCRPGFREIWEPVVVPTYEWDENTDDISIIKNRIRQDQIMDFSAMSQEEIAAEDAKADELFAMYQEGGTLKGYDYDSDTRERWYPLEHLRRVEEMQVYINSPGSKYYGDSEAKRKVASLLDFWVDNDFVCEWSGWNNDIGLGLSIPDILLFDTDGLAEEKATKLLNRMKGALMQNSKLRFKVYERTVNEGGGNLTDQAIASLKVAAIENDGNTIMWLKSLLENELKFFPPYKGPNYHPWDAEGIKEDYSFTQHFEMVYFGGYCEVMLDGYSRYLNYTRGTQFELSKEKLDFYVDFILNGVQYAMRGGYRDALSSGRGSARRGGLRGIAPAVERAANALLKYDGLKREDDLRALLVDRYGEHDKGAGGHRYFYETDYNVMNNAKYMATVRHSSDRNRIFEYLNGENPLGYYTGLGATMFYAEGDEYFDTPVVYNWNQVPGTTAKQSKKVPRLSENSSYNKHGNNKYAMGVSNGTVGVSYFKQNAKGVKANKAYFMFEDGVVCLGSGITSMNLENIMTTINQANVKGDAVVYSGGKSDTLKIGDSRNGVNADFVYHGGFAYFSDNDINISLEHRSGDWKTINEFSSSYKQEGDIFTIGIDHGKRPINKSYAYTVLPGSFDDAKAYLANKTLKIIANDKKVQAVYDSKNDVFEVVFLKKGSILLSSGKTLSCDKPCVMIIDNMSTRPVFTVASCDYSTYSVNIEYDGKTYSKEISKRPLTF